MNAMTRTISTIFVALLVTTYLPVFADDIPEQLPDPSHEAPDTKKPVKVYIMMGQSNMVGFGQISPESTRGTLENLVNKQGNYPYLDNEAGKWTVRKDVWCVQSVAGKRKDWLQPGFGANPKFIGPELGFGHVVGYVNDEMVLIIKASMGIGISAGIFCHRQAGRNLPRNIQTNSTRAGNSIVS